MEALLGPFQPSATGECFHEPHHHLQSQTGSKVPPPLPPCDQPSWVSFTPGEDQESWWLRERLGGQTPGFKSMLCHLQRSELGRARNLTSLSLRRIIGEMGNDSGYSEGLASTGYSVHTSTMVSSLWNVLHKCKLSVSPSWVLLLSLLFSLKVITTISVTQAGPCFFSGLRHRNLWLQGPTWSGTCLP